MRAGVEASGSYENLLKFCKFWPWSFDEPLLIKLPWKVCVDHPCGLSMSKVSELKWQISSWSQYFMKSWKILSYFVYFEEFSYFSCAKGVLSLLQLWLFYYHGYHFQLKNGTRTHDLYNRNIGIRKRCVCLMCSFWFQPRIVFIGRYPEFRLVINECFCKLKNSFLERRLKHTL